MVDKTEEIRKRIRNLNQEERQEATEFERQAKRFYIAQQKEVISWGIERHHQVLGVPLTEPSADFVISNGPHSVIVSEAKGSDIDHALGQLKNTARHVHEKWPLKAIEYHLLLREVADPDNLAPARNQEVRYRARNTQETILGKTKYVLTDGSDEPVRIALSTREPGTKVFVIIGPRTTKDRAEGAG